ncbi:MAG: carboxypeptidase regulatory-like domain-containing protein [Balneolaceae bacterium]|nr:carboxypeptidase regulatory-like domain-containing protein [Balneolaceae bacterium]
MNIRHSSIKIIVDPLLSRHNFVLYFFFTFLFFTLLSTPIQAQNVSLQGFITDGSSGQVLPGANVILFEAGQEEVFRGTATDQNGFYSIGGILPGHYDVRISYLGYVTHEEALDLGDERRITLSKALLPRVEHLDDLVITVRGGATNQTVGHQRIRPADLSRAPTPAGTGDLASYLQIQPGVVAAGDRGGQLFIRGGTPSQNMVFMDGMLIYQPFHIVGFFSAFPEDLVSVADFHSGGFGARYSGRVSSVIDVQMKDGHMYENRGAASISPFVAGLRAEGPIKEGESSWIASVRHSLIEHLGGTFLGEEQPLKFQSHYLKLSHSSDEVRCSGTVLHSYDRGRMDTASGDEVHWGNLTMGGRCLALAGSGALLDVRMNFSRVSNTMDVGHSELQSAVNRFVVDGHVSQPAGRITVGYGGYILMKFLNYDIQEMFFTPQVDVEELIGAGMHLEATVPMGSRVHIQPGVALNFIPGGYGASMEPRFSARWNPFGREEEELSAAFGLYRQPLVGVADRRDVSSVFTGWMPVPIGSSQKEAIHALAGWSQALSPVLQWSVEGFYKRVRNQPVTTWSTNAQFITDLTLARGHVYGGDVRVEYQGSSVYGSLGYGYTWTQYETAQEHFSTWFGEPVQRFHPPHDRRHQINALTSAEAGPYSLSLGWQLGSGLPYTRPFGFDDRIQFENKLPNIMTELGVPRIIMDRPYNARLPVFHRLDISAGRQFRLQETRLNIQAGAVNLYNRANIFYYDVSTHRRIDQLSFAPYLSIKLEVR